MTPISELRELPGNPRRGDVEAIKRSLETFGQRYPIVVRDGVVLAGNHRLQAALSLGWDTIATVDADDLSDDEARAFALADNRTSDLASYDDAALLALLDSIDGVELLEAAGYSDDAVTELLDDLATDVDDLMGAPPKPIGNLVTFRFGDITGQVALPVYDRFVSSYEQHRDDVSASLGHQAFLEDVIVSWLDL